jgi:TolA-binding protein
MVKAIMGGDAMKPMLDLMKSEIVASQQVAIVQLKGSFLQQILQLNEIISEHTTRVVTLEEKIAALQKELKEIKTVQKLTYCKNPQPKTLLVTLSTTKARLKDTKERLRGDG